MLNHIALMGRLTHDPELRRTNSGTAVASFSIACDRDFKPENGERETDFIECVAWRGTAEFVARYFAKGSLICVTGRLQVRPWTDNDGNKRRSHEVIVDNVYFAGAKKDAAHDISTAAAQPSAYSAEDYGLLDDDVQVPFC